MGAILTLVTIALLVGVEFITDIPETDQPIFLEAKGSDESNKLQHSQANFAAEKSFQPIMEIPDEYTRRGMLYLYLGNIDENEALELLHTTRSIANLEDREFSRVAIFTRLASLNPPLAFTQIDQFDSEERPTLTKTLFQEWARIDPHTAIKQAQSLPEKSRILANQVIQAYGSNLSHTEKSALSRKMAADLSISHETIEKIVSLQKMEPQEAWDEFINELTDHDDAMTLAVNVASPWVQRDGLPALKKVLSSISNHSLRRNLLSALADDALKHDPEGLLILLQDYPEANDSHFNTTNKVLKEWTATDPHAAMATAKKLDDQNRSTKLQIQTLKAWGRYDPETVWHYLSNQPRGIRDDVRFDMLFYMTIDAPEEALALVESMENPQEQARTYQLLMRNWGHNSPRSALDRLLSRPEADLDSSLILAAITHLAEENPQEAFDRTISTLVPLKDEMQLRVIQTVAKTDVELAIKFLPEISVEHQLQAATQIGRSMLDYDPSHAIKFGQTLTQNQQEGYYQMLVGGLNNDNVYAFMQVLDEFPTKRLVSKAALSLLRRYQDSDRLTSEDKSFLQDRLSPQDQELLNTPRRNLRR